MRYNACTRVNYAGKNTQKMSNRILYICSQVSPYTECGSIASICRNLPAQMQESGAQIRIFMPRYGSINERRGQLHEVIRLSGMNLIIAETDHQLIIKVASIAGARVQVYFIDNEDFFSRKATFNDEKGNPFEDNDERAIFFARGVVETVKKLRWTPDIVHCHGWISAIAPAYLRRIFNSDPIFSKTKIVLSLHDDAFPGELSASIAGKLKKEGVKIPDMAMLEKPTHTNLMQFAAQYADGFTVNSDNIDSELIQTVEKSGKPTLQYLEDETDYTTRYNPFYEQILSK